MASYGYSGALPGPGVVSVQDENVLRVTKVVIPRAVTVRALSAWLSGVTGGSNRTQSGKLVLYADNGSGTRPLGAPLAYTKQGTWDQNAPKSCYTAWLDPTAFPSGVALAAGTYWIGSWVGASSISSSTLNVHGDTTGGTSLISVPATYSDTTPPTFPTTGGSASAAIFGYAMAVDSFASAMGGAIVGTFKVGDGTKVGPPFSQPGVPQMRLKGGAFQINLITGDFQTVQVGAALMTLAAKVYTFNTTFNLSIPNAPLLTLKAKAFRPVEPDKMQPGKAGLILKGKGFVLNRSATMQVGKAKMLLVGGAINKVGKAGLIPTTPQESTLVPTAARAGVLVPTSSYTGLLTPTRVEVV